MMFYRFDRYMFATLLSRVMTRFQCGEVSAFNRMTEVGLNVPIRVYDARLVAIWDPNITLEQMEPFDAQVSFPAFDQHNRAKSIKTHNIVDEYVKWIVRGGDISLADLKLACLPIPPPRLFKPVPKYVLPHDESWRQRKCMLVKNENLFLSLAFH